MNASALATAFADAPQTAFADAPQTAFADAPHTTFADAPHTTFAEHAYHVLRDRLITLDIAPGSPLNDEILGKELGIGRTPVREAFKKLEGDHLVASFPRRGTFATTVYLGDLAEISEIRERLEPLAAGRAAKFASPETRNQLTLCAENLTAIDLKNLSRKDLIRLDIEVHRSIYRASGSKHLESTLIRYDNLATRMWCLVIDRIPQVSEHIVEHIELLTHIVAGRSEDAEHTAREHVAAFEKLIRSVL